MSLKKIFTDKLLKQLMKDLGKKNIYEVPTLKKIIVNSGIGSYLLKGGRTVEDVTNNITAITGQKPIVVKSKIAVSNFKLRKGMSNGVKVTLRGEKMYDFIERLVNLTFPRIRDFRGISKKAFDKNGNFSLGLNDVTVFPEINLEDISKTHGLQINFSTTASNKDDALALLTVLGLPFQK